MKTFQLKFITPSILLSLVLFILSAIPSSAQSLEGKWNIAKVNTRHSTLIEFTHDSLIFYEFDQRHSATAYQVKDNQIVVDSESIPFSGEFQFINPNRLRLKPASAKKPVDFVRLNPTNTSLTKAEIKQLNFEINYQNNPLPVDFSDPGAGGETIQLENLDDTYFLSFYRGEKRLGAMAIKKITSEEIVVYGFPEKPYEVTGERKFSAEGAAKKNGNAANKKLNVAETIIGKWFYERIAGRPPLSDCTKKTFFAFKDDSSIQIKPFAEDYNNGDCVAGSNRNGTYEINNDNQIKVIQKGKTEIWEIKSLSKTKLVVEKDGGTLTLTKQ